MFVIAKGTIYLFLIFINICQMFLNDTLFKYKIHAEKPESDQES